MSDVGRLIYLLFAVESNSKIYVPNKSSTDIASEFKWYQMLNGEQRLFYGDVNNLQHVISMDRREVWMTIHRETNIKLRKELL